MAKGGSKPGERRGGRQKGTPNKFTGELKQMILTALDESGGVEYLKRQADESPVAFLGLVGKVLPMTLAGDKENPIGHKVEVHIIDPNKG